MLFTDRFATLKLVIVEISLNILQNRNSFGWSHDNNMIYVDRLKTEWLDRQLNDESFLNQEYKYFGISKFLEALHTSLQNGISFKELCFNSPKPIFFY